MTHDAAHTQQVPATHVAIFPEPKQIILFVLAEYHGRIPQDAAVMRGALFSCLLRFPELLNVFRFTGEGKFVRSSIFDEAFGQIVSMGILHQSAQQPGEIPAYHIDVDLYNVFKMSPVWEQFWSRHSRAFTVMSRALHTAVMVRTGSVSF